MKRKLWLLALSFVLLLSSLASAQSGRSLLDGTSHYREYTIVVDVWAAAEPGSAVSLLAAKTALSRNFAVLGLTAAAQMRNWQLHLAYASVDLRLSFLPSSLWDWTRPRLPWLGCPAQPGSASLRLMPLEPRSGQGRMPDSATSSAKTWIVLFPTQPDLASCWRLLCWPDSLSRSAASFSGGSALCANLKAARALHRRGGELLCCSVRVNIRVVS
jgi:hypothetical protein